MPIDRPPIPVRSPIAAPMHVAWRQPASPSPARPPAPIDSAALFDGAREVQIAHGDAIYRLKVTSLGKLILTK